MPPNLPPPPLLSPCGSNRAHVTLKVKLYLHGGGLGVGRTEKKKKGGWKGGWKGGGIARPGFEPRNYRIVDLCL